HGPAGSSAYRSPSGATQYYGAGGGVGYRGPEGRGAYYGPGGTHAYTGRYGGTAVVHNNYYYGGRYYARPGGWNTARVNSWGRYYAGYPGWHSYGLYWGLYPALAGFSTLAFLSAGLLVGSYAYGERTVYVYIVNENGVQKEYRVDSAGNIL